MKILTAQNVNIYFDLIFYLVALEAIGMINSIFGNSVVIYVMCCEKKLRRKSTYYLHRLCHNRGSSNQLVGGWTRNNLFAAMLEVFVVHIFELLNAHNCFRLTHDVCVGGPILGGLQPDFISHKIS